MSQTISILFAKQFTDPDTGLAYSKGVTYPVSHDVAIKAAKARKTIDEAALELMQAAGAKQDAMPSYSKMTKADLIEELKARDLEGGDEQVADLTVQIEAAVKAKEVAEEQLETLNEDVKLVLENYNAALVEGEAKIESLADFVAIITAPEKD